MSRTKAKQLDERIVNWVRLKLNCLGKTISNQEYENAIRILNSAFSPSYPIERIPDIGLLQQNIHVDPLKRKPSSPKTKKFLFDLLTEKENASENEVLSKANEIISSAYHFQPANSYHTILLILYWQSFDKGLGFLKILVDKKWSSFHVSTYDVDGNLNWRFEQDGEDLKKGDDNVRFNWKGDNEEYSTIMLATPKGAHTDWATGCYCWINFRNDVVTGKLFSKKVFTSKNPITNEEMEKCEESIRITIDKLKNLNSSIEPRLHGSEKSKDDSILNFVYHQLYGSRTFSEGIDDLTKLPPYRDTTKAIEKKYSGTYKGIVIHPTVPIICIIKCKLFSSGKILYEYLDNHGELSHYSGIVSRISKGNILLVKLKTESDLYFHRHHCILKPYAGHKSEEIKKVSIILEGIFSGFSENASSPLGGYVLFIKTEEEFQPKNVGVSKKEFEKLNSGFESYFKILDHFLGSKYYPSPMFYKDSRLLKIEKL